MRRYRPTGWDADLVRDVSDLPDLVYGNYVSPQIHTEVCGARSRGKDRGLPECNCKSKSPPPASFQICVFCAKIHLHKGRYDFGPWQLTVQTHDIHFRKMVVNALAPSHNSNSMAKHAIESLCLVPARVDSSAMCSSSKAWH